VSNLDLWNSVDETDPAHTKPAKIGQMKITAIDPQYQRKNATAKFGPYGIGWGILPDSEKLTFRDIGDTALMFYQSTMFYVLDSKRGEFPITSSIKVAYMTSGGKGGSGYLKVDDEALKKAQTDALTKGLSFLGFNADVFMGLFDDSKYVAQRTAEERAKEPIKLTQIDKDWIAACKTDPQAIEQIEDPEYRAFIKSQLGG